MAPSIADTVSASDRAAYEELKQGGYIQDVQKGCSDCGSQLGEPVTRSGVSGKLYFRCSNNHCGKRFNVLEFSPFRGTRMSLVNVCRVLTFYTRANILLPPNVRDCAQQLKLKRCQIEHLYHSLLHLEEKAGRSHCRAQQRLSGAVECDVHAIRKIYVSSSNPFFRPQVKAAVERYRKANPNKVLPLYWQGHVRLMGLKMRFSDGQKRGGRAVIKELPIKLVPPAASPPVESQADS